MALTTRTTPAEVNDESNEGTTPVIPPFALKEFIAAITSENTSAVARAISNVPHARINANAKKISSVIDPYDTKFMDFTSKDRKLHCELATKKTEGWSFLYCAGNRGGDCAVNGGDECFERDRGDYRRCTLVQFVVYF